MDADTFQQEVKQVQKLLFRIAWAYMGNLQDVEDMVQDAIEAALRDTNKFARWIVRILTNCCKNTLRRRKVLSFFPLEESSATVPEPSVKSPVEEALEQFTPESRLLMTLRYTDGYAIRDIAEALELPMGTVQSRLLRARRKLKDILLIEWEGEL